MRNREHGFSLVELLIALVLFGIVSSALLGFILSAYNDNVSLYNTVGLEQQLSLAKVAGENTFNVIGENDSTAPVLVTAASISGQWITAAGVSYTGVWQNLTNGASWSVTAQATGKTQSEYFPVGINLSYALLTSSGCLGPASGLGGGEINTQAIRITSTGTQSMLVCLPNIPAATSAG
jgi:prepilin-type N-terminal cleavage/methylation domain-containing protein